MAMGVHSVNAAVALMVLGSLSTACSDVVVDSIVVERSRGEAQVTPPPPCVRQHGLLSSSHSVKDAFHTSL